LQISTESQTRSHTDNQEPVLSTTHTQLVWLVFVWFGKKIKQSNLADKGREGKEKGERHQFWPIY